jgi:hypothetical protein
VSRFEATWYQNRSFRWFAQGALFAAIGAFPLVYLHSLFSCLVIPLGYLVGFVASDVTSQLIFGRPFHPPTKHGAPEADRASRWSDWLLHAVAILGMLLALFAMGNFADYVRGEDVWKW